jgi:polyphosphate kinase 2 (PPK2 family)
VQNCMQPSHTDELCFYHWSRRETLPKRQEVSLGEREWYAEQGRTLDEQALLARRMPQESAVS